MRKTMWTGTAAAIVAAATVAAMAQAPGAQQSSGSAADKRVTVTGCLKAAPSAADAGTTTAPTGTTGTAGTAGAAGAVSGAADARFVLTEATTSPASNDPSSSTTTAGTPATSAPSASTYRLIANAASLSPHVGKKLELTGTVEDQAASTSTTASAPTGGPALRVEAGKVIAASCE
jgi:hypothetical protein